MMTDVLHCKHPFHHMLDSYINDLSPLLSQFRPQKKLTGKDKQFDAPAPEMASVASSDAGKEGRRSATIIPKDEVTLVRKIGEGAHGSVHEGTWADSHGAVSGGCGSVGGERVYMDECMRPVLADKHFNPPNNYVGASIGSTVRPTIMECGCG